MLMRLGWIIMGLVMETPRVSEIDDRITVFPFWAAFNLITHMCAHVLFHSTKDVRLKRVSYLIIFLF